MDNEPQNSGQQLEKDLDRLCHAPSKGEEQKDETECGSGSSPDSSKE